MFSVQHSKQRELERPCALAESRFPGKTGREQSLGPDFGGKNDKLTKMSLVFGNGYVTERNKSLQFNDGEVVDRAALDSVGIGLFF